MENFKGPWILKDAKESDIHYRVFMDQTEKTEHICEVLRSSEESQTGANAQLIASAPTMINELIRLFEKYGDLQTKEIIDNALKS